MPFYILFILYPLLELWVFVEVSGEIGFFTSLLMLFLAGIIGGAIVRQQGFQTVLSMQDAMDRGKMPLDELFDGFCIVGAGILLIAPGFLSDIVAIILLMPRLRAVIRSFLQKNPQWTARTGDSAIIEGEYEHVAEEVKTIPQKKQP